jgi:hypothetical protein
MPRDWKNGLLKSMLPLTLYVRTMPVGLANPNMLGTVAIYRSVGSHPQWREEQQTVTHARMNRGGCMANLLFIRLCVIDHQSGLRRCVAV